MTLKGGDNVSYKLNFELASKMTERTVIENYEFSETKEHIDITYILASSVPNDNGALITKEELANSKDSIVNEPLIIVPDFDDLPTGHSLEKFPALSWGAVIVGTHIGSSLVEEDGITHLQATARVWKIRYPELANVMTSLHEAGNLKFSMESRFTSQTVEGATRTLNGVKFIGAAVVNDPANPFSYALEVANKRKKEEKIVDFEQAMKALKEANADAYIVIEQHIKGKDSELATANSSIETLKGDKEQMKLSLEQANKNHDTVANELAQIKKEKAEAEVAQKQEKRFEEISEYVTFEEEEIASKKEAYGKMSDDTWEILIETAKRNKKAKDSNVEFASDTSIDLQKPKKGFLDGLGE